jgi:hypothetical protein
MRTAIGRLLREPSPDGRHGRHDFHGYAGNGDRYTTTRPIVVHVRVDRIRTGTHSKKHVPSALRRAAREHEKNNEEVTDIKILTFFLASTVNISVEGNCGISRDGRDFLFCPPSRTNSDINTYIITVETFVSLRSRTASVVDDCEVLPFRARVRNPGSRFAAGRLDARVHNQNGVKD